MTDGEPEPFRMSTGPDDVADDEHDADESGSDDADVASESITDLISEASRTAAEQAEQAAAGTAPEDRSSDVWGSSDDVDDEDLDAVWSAAAERHRGSHVFDDVLGSEDGWSSPTRMPSAAADPTVHPDDITAPAATDEHEPEVFKLQIEEDDEVDDTDLEGASDDAADTEPVDDVVRDDVGAGADDLGEAHDTGPAAATRADDVVEGWGPVLDDADDGDDGDDEDAWDAADAAPDDPWAAAGDGDVGNEWDDEDEDGPEPFQFDAGPATSAPATVPDHVATADEDEPDTFAFAFDDEDEEDESVPPGDELVDAADDDEDGPATWDLDDLDSLDETDDLEGLEGLEGLDDLDGLDGTVETSETDDDGAVEVSGPTADEPDDDPDDWLDDEPPLAETARPRPDTGWDDRSATHESWTLDGVTAQAGDVVEFRDDEDDGFHDPDAPISTREPDPPFETESKGLGDVLDDLLGDIDPPGPPATAAVEQDEPGEPDELDRLDGSDDVPDGGPARPAAAAPGLEDLAPPSAADRATPERPFPAPSPPQQGDTWPSVEDLAGAAPPPASTGDDDDDEPDSAPAATVPEDGTDEADRDQDDGRDTPAAPPPPATPAGGLSFSSQPKQKKGKKKRGLFGS